jgi:rod shape-determining protein MreC
MKRILFPFVPLFLLSLLLLIWGGFRFALYKVLMRSLYIPLIAVEARFKEFAELSVERDSLVQVNLRMAGILRECLSRRLEEIWSQGFEGEAVRILALRPQGVPERLILEGGEDRGFHFGMPVLQRGKLVGRISEVSTATSTALTLFSPQLRVGVATLRKGVIGVLEGGLTLSLKYIPKGSDVVQGDTLVTSGLGGVFPRGIPVAVVTSVEVKESELFLKISARPLFDMSLLGSVEIVKW